MSFEPGTQIAEGAPGYGLGQGRVEEVVQKYHGWKNLLLVITGQLFALALSVLPYVIRIPPIVSTVGALLYAIMLWVLMCRNREVIRQTHCLGRFWWLLPEAPYICCSPCCNPNDPVVISTPPLHSRRTKVWIVEAQQAPTQQQMRPPEKAIAETSPATAPEAPSAVAPPPGQTAAVAPVTAPAATDVALAPESLVVPPAPPAGDGLIEVKRFEQTAQGASIDIAVDKVMAVVKVMIKTGIAAVVPGVGILEVAAALGHAAVAGANAAMDSVVEDLSGKLELSYKHQTAKEKVTKFKESSEKCFLMYAQTTKTLVESGVKTCVASMGKYSITVVGEIVVMRGINKDFYEKTATVLRARTLGAVLDV